jgi:hypothetical protein
VIVAGGRDFCDYIMLRSRLLSLLRNHDPSTVTIVCGKARGADTLGEWFATEFGLNIDYYPADWDRFGKKAGYIRNAEMAENATHLVAFWDGTSKGTKSMIDLAKSKGLVTRIYRY